MEEGAWVRVRIEGWLPREQAIASDSDGGVGTTTLSAVRADPDRYVGTVVRWRVQSLGLQRADSLRSDLSPGESYLLARDPGGEAGFVYVVVPPERLPEVSALVPLQRVEVQARVRNGRSPLTGHPILDLLELHP